MAEYNDFNDEQNEMSRTMGLDLTLTAQEGDTSIQSSEKKGRIEYIDAMRGLTMLLVVYWHVAVLYVEDNYLWSVMPTDWTFNTIFLEFRMPLFFFVSGFVLYKASRVWTGKEILNFFKKKTPIQLIFPMICLETFLLTVNSSTSFVGALFLGAKFGYWFTFVLLEFYVFYIALKLLPLKGKAEDIGQWVISALLMFTLQYCALLDPYFPNEGGLIGLLSVPEWQYFFFFIFGVQVRKHFTTFEELLDNGWFIIICLLGFIGINITSIPRLWLNVLGGIFGVVLVFAFFRHYRESFTKEKRLGRIMQYVGKRTLDVYLIHYFFIYANCNTGAVLRHFVEGQPLLELLCFGSIAVVIVALSLVASNVLRLSPFVAHYFFGAKKK